MSTYTRSHIESMFETRTTEVDAYTNYFGVPVPKFSSDAKTTYQIGYADSAVGADQPQWQSIIARGDNATNGLVAQRTTFSHSPYSGQSEYYLDITPPPQGRPKQRRKFYGSPVFPAVTNGAPDTSTYNAALMGFVRKANSRISSFQGGPFLGELRETIQLLKHPVERIPKLLGDYLGDVGRKRGRAPKNPRKRRRFLQDKWLEYSFGIMPLVNDIQDAAQSVSRLINNMPPPEHISFQAGGSAKVLEGGPEFASVDPPLLTWCKSLLIKDEFKVTLYGAVRLENPHSGIYLRETLGIRPDLFIPTIWELIPYSWLVDYFSNVGNVIEAACFNMARLRWLGCSNKVTRRNIVRFHGNATDTHQPNYINSYVSGGENEMRTESISRFVPSSLVPTLQVTLPNKWKQWANMTAIATQHRRLTPY